MTNLKKSISVLLSISIIISLFAFSGIHAFANESGNFKYSVVNGNCANITGYTGNETSLDIPSKIDGYTVTGVDANTFFYAKELESVIFPSTVTSISQSVFQGYVNIKEIVVNDANKNYSSKDGVLFNKTQTSLLIYPKGNDRTAYSIPETVTLISSHAFYGSENLTEIIIPNGVKTIEYYAFDSCTSLTGITLPASVSSIGNLAFYRCLSLENIIVDDENKSFSSDNGVLFNKSQTDLILYPSANENTTYDVPSSVKNISAYAFDSASNLLNVSLPGSLKTIGSNAFKACVSLSGFTVPNSVVLIDSGAFHGCVSLASVKLSDSISKINDDTFYNCENLKDIAVPDGVKSIGRYAFAGCKSLNEIVVPNGVTAIGKSAFNGCSSAVSVSLPESVTVVDDSAFSLCGNISDVYFGGSKTDWTKIEIGVDNKCITSANIHFGKLHFIDLAGFESYNDYVMYTSVYNDFITGTNPPARTAFSPKDSVTRAMFVTILYRMAGEPYNNGRNPHSRTPFADIKDTGVYYYNAACWALDNGITNQKYFKPNDYVSREQTAVFLFRYAEANHMIEDDSYQSTSLEGYRDYSTVSSWAAEAMQWANYNGMITGTQQNTLNPQGATQRIHATKILYGFGKVCNIGNFA